MAGEAKLKLSVDTSQAQQQIKLIDQQLNELGRGSSSIGTKKSDTSGKSSGIDEIEVERLINAQERFLSSFTDYMNNSRQTSQAVSSKLDKINESLKPRGGSSSSSGGSGGGIDGIKGVLGKLATGATVAMAVRSLISYMKQGATSSANSELQAYNIFNTTDLYDGNYSGARNVQAGVGSPYGYDVYATLGAQSRLIDRTGITSQENITADTQALLKTSRALSIDETGLASTFGDFYQTGTYGKGELGKFANLFATSIQEAGMVGREDEQLEILESINKLLDQNLTTITENQYGSALGLYSLFSSSKQALSGSRSASLVGSLNSAITGGSNTMDIALGKYSGSYGSLWEFEQQKEKGISDPRNLSSIIDYFEKYAGLDLSSDTGKFTLQKFLQSNGADLSTEEIEGIISNLDSIRSGEYSNMFSTSVGGSKGGTFIDDQYSDYESSKLDEMLTYNAESLNAMERIGDFANEATSTLKDLYNDLPQWMQNLVSGTGSVAGTVGNLALGAGSTWLGGKAAGKLFGDGGIFSKSTKVPGEFSDFADEILDAYNLGGGEDDIAKAMGKISKGGKLPKGATDWADELVEAANKGADLDEILGKGYKKFGKTFAKNAASSSDEALSGVGKGLLNSSDDAMLSLGKGFSVSASTLSKAGKALGIVGTAFEVGNTALETYKAVEEGDYRTAYKEVGGGTGSIAGGWAGASAGASAGAYIGAFGGPIGILAGGLIGGLLGGIGGSLGGEALGEAGGGLIYDITSDDIEDASSATVYNTNALDRNTEELKNSKISSSTGFGVPYSPSYIQNSFATSTLNRSIFKPHAIGADYIPYDGYLAELHKGETVLDAHTANEYRNGTLGSSGTSSTLEIKVSGGISGINGENQNRIVTEIVNQIRNQMSNSSIMNQLAFNNVRMAN